MIDMGMGPTHTLISSKTYIIILMLNLYFFFICYCLFVVFCLFVCVLFVCCFLFVVFCFL